MFLRQSYAFNTRDLIDRTTPRRRKQVERQTVRMDDRAIRQAMRAGSASLVAQEATQGEA